MNGLNLAKRVRMGDIMHNSPIKEKPLVRASGLISGNIGGDCFSNTSYHITNKSKVQMTFEDSLVRHNIPYPSKEFRLNAFLRWGRNNRYWAYQSNIGFSFGDWITGTKEFVFCPLDELLQCNSDIIKQHLNQLTQIQEENYIRVAINAKNLWNNASQCLTHPYLEKKQVLPHRIRINKQNNLVIPLLSAEGRINSLQYIDNLGNNRFLSGGRKKGCYFPIGSLQNRILLSEGYATASSIHIATGELTLCCFDAGNILPTAEAIRNKYPNIEMVICADNDCYSKINTGLLKAIEAGNRIKAKIVYPVFQSLDTKPTDFNDLHCLEGLEIVRQQIVNAFNGGNYDGQ